MIAELVVLFGIQHLQKSGGRISLIVAAHLVNLVQKHQRVLHPGLLHTCWRYGPASRLHRFFCGRGSPPHPGRRPDRSGHISCPGLWRSSWAIEVLPVPGGPTRQIMGLSPFFVSGADSQKFQHPLLDLLKAVMILVQDLPGIGEIHVVNGFFIPGQVLEASRYSPGSRNFPRSCCPAFLKRSISFSMRSFTSSEASSLSASSWK